MLESKLWDKVSHKNKVVYMERVENNVACGTPDFHWLVPKVHAGWCELKCGVRRKNKFDWLGKYTLIQRRWGKRYVELGGNYLFCAADQHNEIWWWGGKAATIIDALPIDEAIDLCIGRGPDFPSIFLKRIKKRPAG